MRTLKIILCLADSNYGEQTNAKLPRVIKDLPCRGSFSDIAHRTFEGFGSVSVSANTAIPVILICTWPQNFTNPAVRQNINSSNTRKISITFPKLAQDRFDWIL